MPQNVIDFLESKRELAKTSEYWHNWCEVYLFGREGKLQGTIFNDYKIIDKIPEGARLLGLGMDFGFTNDPSTLIAIYKWNDDSYSNFISNLENFIQSYKGFFIKITGRFNVPNNFF